MMLVSDIVKRLPSVLDWMVLFNLDVLRPLFDDLTMKRMFFIPEEVSLGQYSHAILIEQGTLLAPISGEPLQRAQDGGACPALRGQPSLLQRFAAEASHFPIDEADCLGLGEVPGFFPGVALFIRVEGPIGHAQALFAQPPSQLNYELLQAVGAHFLDGEWLGDDSPGGHYIARFTVDLRQHIFAGLLSGFSKTGYCNAFFLQHGTIGPTLEAGLSSAAHDRVSEARRQVIQAACKLAEEALSHPLPMQCQPLPPMSAFDFGDVAPLGLLAHCLKADASTEVSDWGERLAKLLLACRSGELWPFQRGDIPTATDSALALFGLIDAQAVQALERYSDGNGGYYPQAWRAQDDLPSRPESRDADEMKAGDWNAHWCQVDFATTCLVRSHRRIAGLPQVTPVEFLEANFEWRSGLFFANPYLVDWSLALALQGDESQPASLLRHKLAAEITNSMNPDHTFGKFDIPLSTALAILSLSALGYAGRQLLLAQLRLAEKLESGETWQVSIPFFSTYKLPGALRFFYGAASTADDPSSQVINVGDDAYAISYYLDQHQVVTTAIMALALTDLTRETSGRSSDTPKTGLTAGVSQATTSPHTANFNSHPRYACRTHAQYIERWVMPRYAEKVPIQAS